MKFIPCNPCPELASFHGINARAESVDRKLTNQADLTAFILGRAMQIYEEDAEYGGPKYADENSQVAHRQRQSGGAERELQQWKQTVEQVNDIDCPPQSAACPRLAAVLGDETVARYFRAEDGL